MNYPQELVQRYTAFYLPYGKKGGYSATGTVKPLKIAAKILLHPDNIRLSPEEMKLSISAEIAKLMQQCRHRTTEGRFVLGEEAERSAITEFARFFVDEFFLQGCQGRRDLLSGNKFALTEHACEFLVRGL